MPVYPDDYNYTPDEGLWKEAFESPMRTSRNKTIYSLITRDVNNKPSEDGQTNNIATASLWLRYNNRPVIKEGTRREVYEISWGGVRQMGASS